MDILKKVFPISFKFADTVVNLIIGILIYFVLGAVAGAVIGFLSDLPVVGFLFGLVGSLIGIYGIAGIGIEVLAFLKIV